MDDESAKSNARRASRAGSVETRRFAARFPSCTFRELDGLAMSSIGWTSPRADGGDVRGAITTAADLGVNVFDVVPFARAGRDEECLAEALRSVDRGELVLMAHAGVLAEPVRDYGVHTRWLDDRFVSRGTFAWDELALGNHTLAPAFLTEAIDASTRRLGTSLDVLLLESPATQLAIVDEATLYRRIRRAFEALEAAVSSGTIARYGVANVARLELEKLVDGARDVAGAAHHLRVIETPVSLHDAAATTSQEQTVRGRARTILEAADELGLYVCATGAVLGGSAEYEMDRATRASLGPVTTDAQIGLQWVRSLAGVGTVLVGMRREIHVEENCRVGAMAPAPQEVVTAFLPDEEQEEGQAA